MLDLHAPETTFQIGKALWVDEGMGTRAAGQMADLTFVATGETVAPSLLAARELAKDGIDCRVLSVHTIKPLDTTAILGAARQSRAMITVEEHSVHGGLGGACAELLMAAGVMLPFQIVGIPDEYTVTGSQAEIFAHYGITPEGLAAKSAHAARSSVEGRPREPCKAPCRTVNSGN